jgi:hypothetical protein
MKRALDDEGEGGRERRKESRRHDSLPAGSCSDIVSAAGGGFIEDAYVRCGIEADSLSPVRCVTPPLRR